MRGIVFAVAGVSLAAACFAACTHTTMPPPLGDCDGPCVPLKDSSTNDVTASETGTPDSGADAPPGDGGAEDADASSDASTDDASSDASTDDASPDASSADAQDDAADATLE